VNPTLYKLSFNVAKDLQPVIRLTVTNYMLVVHPSVRANTLKEFIEFAKSRPDTLSYGSAGLGSPHHLSAELLKTRAGINMAHPCGRHPNGLGGARSIPGYLSQKMHNEVACIGAGIVGRISHRVGLF